LQRLTNMERDRIIEEHDEVLRQIARYEEILANEQEVMKIIVGELQEVRKLYADERRTEIVDETFDISVEDMIADDDMVVTISHEGYIKRNPVTLYRAQRRGGRGKIGAVTKDEDFVENLFVASAHTYILFFTTRGKLYWIKVHGLPQAGRAARGKAVVNLLRLQGDEKVSAVLLLKEFTPGQYIFFATRKGTVKKTALEEYANPRPSGIIALKLNQGDEVIGVRLTDGQQELILSTCRGQSIRFAEGEVRPMGRAAAGVRGIHLGRKDRVVSVDIAEPGSTLLAVSENGYGKCTPVDAYRTQGRGGKGIITMKVTGKTGDVVGVRRVQDDDDVMLITDGGTVIRTPVGGISIIGRNTQGVRLIDVGEGNRVVGVATLAETDPGNETGGNGTPGNDGEA